MSKLRFLALFLLTLNNYGYAQFNPVPNPSLEYYIEYPRYFSAVETEKKYTIKDADISADESALTINGNYFFYLKSNHLFCYDIGQSEYDSIPFYTNPQLNYNVIAGMSDVVILSTDKNDAYRLDTAKWIFLNKYDNSLENTASDKILVTANAKIPIEDFHFKSYYFDEKTGTYYFNNYFGFSALSKKNAWQSGYINNFFMDPMLGKSYSTNERNLSKDAIYSDEGIGIKISEKSGLPKSFSVIDGKIVYYYNGFYYFKHQKDTEWTILSKRAIDGGFRWIDGLYRFRNDTRTLTITQLF